MPLPKNPCDRCHNRQTVVVIRDEPRSYHFLCHTCFVQLYPQVVDEDLIIVPSRVGWELFNDDDDPAEMSSSLELANQQVFTEPPAYSPLQAAVDVITRLAPLELEAGKLNIPFDPRAEALIDRCTAYIYSQIPEVDNQWPQQQEPPTMNPADVW